MAEGDLFLAQPMLRTIGAVRLMGADGHPILINGRRTRALLAYLCLIPGQTTTRERLCGLLWGDRGEPQARASLRQCLFELSATLRSANIAALEAGRDRVSVIPGALTCDVTLLETALARSDIATAITMIDAMGSASLLSDLDIGGLFAEWQEQTKARIDAAIASAVVTLLDRLEQRSEWGQVRALADAWVRCDPLNDNVVAAAIRADMASGSPALAHRRFQSFAELLGQELGIAPGDTVRDALRGVAPPLVSAISVPAPVSSEPILAVLAFDNLSSDPEMDYFAEGVSEEILQLVSKTTALKVIARASSFQFRGRDKVTSKIAADLGVTHLLDGSVRRGGDKVRITAALVDCHNQTTIWSGSFDRSLTDIFALQDEIALAVAKGLNLIMIPSGARDRIDPEAHDLYLRARHLASSPAHVADCVHALEAAVDHDPDYAAAWASLAMARAVNVRWMVANEDFAVAREQATLAAARASVLDPAAGLPLVALSLLEPDGRFAAREALLERAMSLTPDDPEILKQMSDFAGSVGRVDEAKRYMMRASALDPLNPQLHGHCVFARLGPENRDPVYREAMAMIDRWPDFDWALAMPLLFAAQLGDRHIVEELLQRQGHSREWHMAVAAAKQMTQPIPQTQAETLTAAEQQIAARGSVEIRTLLFMYRIGLRDETFDAWARSDYDYRRSQRPDSVFLLSMIFGILNTEIRKDVRFMDICARLGMCDYWLSTNRWPDCVNEVAPYYDLQREARRRVGFLDLP
ncbi:MAG: BTAD domain-containing putative transcriptional regulator [Sphingomonadaceae bacterium]